MTSTTDTLFFDLIARDKASKELLKVSATIGAVGFAIGKFAKSSIEAYKDAEASQAKLEQAYKKFPKTADKSIDSMREINKQLQKTTKYDDDATAAAEAHLAQYDLTGQQIATLIPLVQDYATATGKDLESATKDVGKAIIGQGRALKNVGIDFKNTGTKAGNLTELQKKLNEKVGGFATNEGKTAAGQAEILKNQYGDLQETVGAALVPALGQLVGVGTQILDFFNALPDPVKQATVFIGLLGGAALIAAPKVLALKELLGSSSGIGKTAAQGTGALGKFAGFLGAGGPWGLALTAGITAIGFFAAANAEAKQYVDDLTEAIKADSGAIGANTRERVVNELQHQGLLETARKAGLSLKTYTDAVLGNSDAQKAIKGEIDLATESIKAQIRIQEKAGHGIDGQLSDQLIAYQRLKDAIVDQTGALDEAAQAQKDAAKAMGTGKGAVDRLADAYASLAHNAALAAWYTGATGKQGQRTSGRVEPRAAGGPVKAGSPYMVGENGPELYVPNHNGSIVPNGAVGGRVSAVNITITAESLLNGLRKEIRVRGGDVQTTLGA